MKKFILNLAVVIALLLIVSTVLQLLISWRISDKSINGKDNFHIVKGQVNDIVFMGSSRSAQHFDPGIFRDSLGLKCVNVGVAGHGDLTMQTLRMKYYLLNNPPPKIVMLNFDPLCTYGPYNPDKNENLIEKHFYARYAFMPDKDDRMV